MYYKVKVNGCWSVQLIWKVRPGYAYVGNYGLCRIKNV